MVENAKSTDLWDLKKSDVSSVGTNQTKEREKWGSKAEFLLSCIGLSVGIGNVWRFPHLAYQNGGGAFLIPYLIILILVGKPMYYMELALGQFSQRGAVASFKMMVPAAKGVGMGMTMICLITAIYYNVLMAYCVFYIAASFNYRLPWTHCDWEGADLDICYVRCDSGNASSCNAVSNFTSRNTTHNVTRETAAAHYWKKYVLNQTDGLTTLGDTGELKWDLVLCLLLSWLIVFVCLMKGIKSSGKVVYVTATTPFIILLILLVRSVTLEGAGTGLLYFFTPQWDKLLEFNVWRKAAEQMFFSLSVAWGAIIMFGSYNEFRNNVTRDAMIVTSLDTITSVVAGTVIFSVLGYLANVLGKDISEVSDSGPGLAFVVYPEAVSLLPVPQLWAVIFFLMLFTLGLDSEFALLEAVLTAVYDGFPNLRKYKIICTAILCTSCFFVGLPCVSNSGIYIFNLMDEYGGGFAVTFIAVFELITVMWIYGINKFSKDLEFMLGSKVGILVKICWAVCCPVLLIVILIASLATLELSPLPAWASAFGWMLTMVSVLQLPLWLIIAIYRYGVKEHNLKQAFQPLPSWGPGDPIERAVFNNSINDLSAHDNPIPVDDDLHL